MIAAPAAADYHAILEPAPRAAVRAAIELGIFDLLAAGRRTAADVAASTAASFRAVDRLLAALAETGLLARAGAEYALAPPARGFLGTDRTELLNDLAGVGHPFDHLWSAFGDVVRRGGPVDSLDVEQFFADMVPGLALLHAPIAARAASFVGECDVRRGGRVLDIACGSAVWSRAMAAADPTCRITAQDLPAVIERTRDAIAAAGLSSQYSYVAGSLESADLGRAEYDVVILAHILHLLSEHDSRALVARAREALRPGGVLLVAEFLGEPDRRGPRFALLFSLLMLVLSRDGDVWTMSHLCDWAEGAGLRTIRTRKYEASEATLVLCSE